MEEDILKDIIHKQVYWTEFKILVCSLNAHNITEKISFKFEYAMITIPLLSLFKISEKNMESYFQMDSNPYVNSSALLGIRFLELFNYTIFDYENRQI